ncbi:DUF4857 domain-containing protein [Opitutus sp. ER46]|uniref:DUF4857 domain-containing protein n=1 Tax=Opitutus sp. ER46 TaxID=2161864 RepID=UPI000D2F5EF4|nr:DUF4857 domain-containing protein [Opitutus sp. ER46]PTX96524.1 hypothetical protein DB354_07660 [Opitutus sp. ER46]
MKLAARALLLLTSILLLGYYLPAGFWLVAARRDRAPVVFYSCVENRFLFSRATLDGVRYADAAGRSYDRDEFERLLPLTNWAQLTKDGRMPKVIQGTPVTLEAVRRAQFSLRLTPDALDTPQVRLFPLLEAESGRARLELPSDFLRLGATVEFLDPKTNTVLTDKSARFAAAFATVGFQFPVHFAANNPTNRKPYDEGAYLVDAAQTVFHLRQVRGKPELHRVVDLAAPEQRARWTDLRIRHLLVQEIDSREIHSLIVERNGAVTLDVGPAHRLVTLPLQHYVPAAAEVTIRGNLLHRLVVVRSDDWLEAIVLDRNYALVDRHEERLTPRDATSAGRLARLVFPFSWTLTDASSGYLGFHLHLGSPWAFALNGVLLVGWLAWRFLRRERSPGARRDWLAAGGVAVTGVFGVLAAILVDR